MLLPRQKLTLIQRECLWKLFRGLPWLVIWLPLPETMLHYVGMTPKIFREIAVMYDQTLHLLTLIFLQDV